MQLIKRGVAVVLPDHFGTGDSAGDFSDATWQAWLDDVARTAQWSAQQGLPLTGVLAIRVGCALAVEATTVGGLVSVDRSVLWQPIFDGGRLVTQFLRLRLAANLTEDRKETIAELRRRLASGETLEVAGYRLSGRLAADLMALGPPARLPGGLGEIGWFEVVREAATRLPVSSQALIERSRALGGDVRELAIVGEPFWTSTEITVVPEVVSATVEHLCGVAQSRGG